MDKEFLKWLDEELETQRSDYEFLKNNSDTPESAWEPRGQITALENVLEQVKDALHREAME